MINNKFRFDDRIANRIWMTELAYTWKCFIARSSPGTLQLQPHLRSWSVLMP